MNLTTDTPKFDFSPKIAGRAVFLPCACDFSLLDNHFYPFLGGGG